MMQQEKTRGRRKCPKCGERAAIPIIRGMPGSELFEAELRGEVHLGGCTITGDDPEWHCRACGHEFGFRTNAQERAERPQKSRRNAQDVHAKKGVKHGEER